MHWRVLFKIKAVFLLTMGRRWCCSRLTLTRSLGLLVCSGNNLLNNLSNLSNGASLKTNVRVKSFYKLLSFSLTLSECIDVFEDFFIESPHAVSFELFELFFSYMFAFVEDFCLPGKVVPVFLGLSEIIIDLGVVVFHLFLLIPDQGCTCVFAPHVLLFLKLFVTP